MKNGRRERTRGWWWPNGLYYVEMDRVRGGYICRCGRLREGVRCKAACMHAMDMSAAEKVRALSRELVVTNVAWGIETLLECCGSLVASRTVATCYGNDHCLVRNQAGGDAPGARTQESRTGYRHSHRGGAQRSNVVASLNEATQREKT